MVRATQPPPSATSALSYVYTAVFLQHTHTHTFNGPLSGTTQVSRYQKGKTSVWILLKQETVGGSGVGWAIMQVCISLQTDNHASTPPLIFLQAGCPSCRPTNSVNAPEAESTDCYTLQHESKTFIHLKLLKNFLKRLKILGHS